MISNHGGDVDRTLIYGAGTWLCPQLTLVPSTPASWCLSLSSNEMPGNSWQARVTRCAYIGSFWCRLTVMGLCTIRHKKAEGSSELMFILRFLALPQLMCCPAFAVTPCWV